MINFGKAHSGRDTLEGLAHYGLGGACLPRIVQPNHQQENRLVCPQAAHLALRPEVNIFIYYLLKMSFFSIHNKSVAKYSPCLGPLETRGTLASHHFLHFLYNFIGE